MSLFHAAATDQPEGVSTAKKVLERSQELYKGFVSPLLHGLSHSFLPGGGCRFQPSCSEYATLAVSQRGVLGGVWLATLRLLRCHPFARGGWDPVPSPRRQPLHPVVPAHPAANGTIRAPHSTHDPA